MLYAHPNTPGAKLAYKPQYDNFINGRFTAPVKGQYFDVITPISGKVYTRAARSSAEDIELALDAAHAASARWAATTPAERANVLLRIADCIEQNLELLAYAETVDNGKPIRETLNADIPLAVDHFRYFAGCVRAQEGALSEIDPHTIAYHFHEPLGVVGQIIPWNFPILMAAWKLAPALGAGNCVVLKPAESTPVSILVLAELLADLLPLGVLNIVNGYGREAGMPLATSKRIAKIAFTGSTATGRTIAQAAAANLIPATLELGGKSPNVLFDDVMAADDAFLDKAIEGLVLFAFNQGEVCTCPSRALIQESIYAHFIDRALKRVAAIRQGNPLDTDTMMGAQASALQMDKIMSYLEVGKQEGAQVLIGGGRTPLGGELAGGYYISSPRSSRATTACACSGRRSSARCWRWPPSRTRPRPWPLPTTRPTAWAPVCGRAMAAAPTAWAAPSRPGACGPTATTPTRPTRPSAATRNQASAARRTRPCWTTTSRPRTCW